MKENNYSEITITDFIYSDDKENKLIKDFITELKNLGIHKIYFAENSTSVLKYLYIFQESGCTLGNIFLFKDSYNIEQASIEINVPEKILLYNL